MKMTAFNPLIGNIFRPEVTLVMDAGQRFVVGWSLSLSENVIALLMRCVTAWHSTGYR
ncbi:hypothetical protein QT346_13410 [Escherichia coli]|nr:hypothetical protein [Escherichia coli]